MTTQDELPTNPATPSALPHRIRLGIDVWHGINPARLDWIKLRATHSFVLVRLCYGSMPDRLCVEHTKHARAAGFSLGSWMFFRATQSVESQLGTFAKQAAKCGVSPGWIVPALDIEDDGERPVQPGWCGSIRRILSAWHNSYGAPPLVYCSRNDWTRLGSPLWLLEYPLWVAHWDTQKPRTPGDRQWSIWQNKVAPLPGIYNTDIDQDVARGALPRIPLLTPRDKRQAEAVRNLAIDRAARNR